MEVLGIGPLEALFVVLIALVVVGPSELSKVARSAGRTLNRIYRSEIWHNITEASRNLRTLPNRLAREAALDELDQMRKDLRDEVTRDLRSDLGLKQTAGEQPQQDPSAEAAAGEAAAGAAEIPPGAGEAGSQAPAGEQGTPSDD